MAIQFPNFLGHGEQAADYSGISDVFKNALQGYKTAKEPAAMERGAEKENLANALQRMAVQHKPTEYSLHDALVRAQTQKALQPSERETPDQKMARMVETEAQKRGLKKREEIEELAKQLANSARDVGGIQQLLDKEGQSVTGPLQGLANKVGLGGKEMGEFNERATRLQAGLARMISARGGAVAAQIAAKGKPSEWRTNAYNIGITKSMQDNIENEFKSLKDEYKKLTGEDLPYSIDNVFHEVTKNVAKEHNDQHGVVHMKSPDGKDVWIPEERVEDAISQGATHA